MALGVGWATSEKWWLTTRTRKRAKSNWSTLVERYWYDVHLERPCQDKRGWARLNTLLRGRVEDEHSSKTRCRFLRSRLIRVELQHVVLLIGIILLPRWGFACGRRCSSRQLHCIGRLG